MDAGRNGTVRMLISLGYSSWVDKGAEKEGPRDKTQQKIVLKARSVFCILELSIATICILCMSEQLLVKHLRCGKCVCAQSCPTLFDPMDSNLPGSSVHGIFQVWILEWVAFLQGIFPTQGSNPRLLSPLHWQVCSLPLVPSGKPKITEMILHIRCVYQHTYLLDTHCLSVIMGYRYSLRTWN